MLEHNKSRRIVFNATYGEHRTRELYATILYVNKSLTSDFKLKSEVNTDVCDDLMLSCFAHSLNL